MAGFTPNEGEIVILNLIYKNADVNRGSSLELGLFTNTSVSETITEATITEPSGGGYARKTLTDASWTVASDGSGQASYASQTFTATASWGNVYGYFIATTGTSAKILHIEVDINGPYAIGNGDSYEVDLSNVVD